MRGFFAAAAIAAAIALVSCVTTKSSQWQPVSAPTMELLGGKWSGTWVTAKLNGNIDVTITPASNYAVTTIDGDPYATKNTWQSAVSIAGDQVIIDANGFDRKETYRLYSDEDGNLMLDGSYTFKGELWGKLRLQKEIEQTSGTGS